MTDSRSGDAHADLRRLPKIDRLLDHEHAVALIAAHGRGRVVAALRDATDELRRRLAGGAGAAPDDDLAEQVLRAAATRLAADARRTLRRAINATGVVLHTGLGRAVLAPDAVAAATEAAMGHCLLEADPVSGDRGQRQSHIAPLLRELLGAEDALAVNNCAAAVLLALTTLAHGREVIIARGQQVEIGGSFRMPDVIRQSGARIVEVGATNKVRLSDYAAAITADTAVILKVHRSNFRLVGFTAEPSLEELAQLGRDHNIPVMEDLGSGALVDLREHGLAAEPTVAASVNAGADVITFSGDKLLGGPQAGIILGTKSLLSRMARHPLMRVVRLDKIAIAALEATLRLYRDEARALREIPTLAALTATPEVLRERADALRRALLAGGLCATLADGVSQVGGGTLPGEELPTTLVILDPGEIAADEAARRLRMGEPSIWCRIQRDRLVFDPRTVTAEELAQIAVAATRALATDAPSG